MMSNARRVPSVGSGMKAFGTTIGTAMVLHVEDSEAKMATALSDSDGQMLEVMELGRRGER